MLSGTVEGTLIEARASEEALGNCQRKCCPKRWEEVFFVEWLRGFLFWWRFHPTILKQLYTLLHYCTISCLKKPWKNTQKHPAYFSKGWNNGRVHVNVNWYIYTNTVRNIYMIIHVCMFEGYIFPEVQSWDSQASVTLSNGSNVTWPTKMLPSTEAKMELFDFGRDVRITTYGILWYPMIM